MIATVRSSKPKGRCVERSESSPDLRMCICKVHLPRARREGPHPRRSDVLLPFLDAEVSQALVGALQRSGIVFHWRENVQKCIPLESGGVRLELSSGAALTGDSVLVAAGRQSNTAKLGLEKAGVKTGE
jgi:Pyridine nucleotide-disulphide oxidoreductase